MGGLRAPLARAVAAPVMPRDGGKRGRAQPTARLSASRSQPLMTR